jgi:PBSX family phage terminase large subunit
MKVKTSEIFLNKYHKPFDLILNNKHEYKYYSMINPRSSTKTSAMGELVLLTSITKQGDWLILRKNSNTLDTSVIEEIFEKIYKYELSEYFTYNKTTKILTYLPNGNKMFFRGLDKENIKGFKTKNKLQGCWVEEAQQFKEAKELEMIIQTAIKNVYDYFVYFETGNGNPKPSHWINERIKYVKNNKQFLYIWQDYRDLINILPKTLIEQIEMTKLYDYETYRTDYLGEFGTTASAIYKRFDRQVVLKDNIDVSNFKFHVVGVDYGETHGTAFTYSVIRGDFSKVGVKRHYYHINGDNKESSGLKDINDYAKDFVKFLKDVHELCGQKMLLQIDSASLPFINVALKLIEKERLSFAIYERLNKKTVLHKVSKKDKEKNDKKSNIESRISITNLMIGKGMLEIEEFTDKENNIDSTKLVEAFELAEYNDNMERRDDGTSNIDSIDSFEYTINEFMNNINNYIFKQN